MAIYQLRRNPKVISKLKVNDSVQGDTIEVQMQRLMEGEGIDGVEERDLVYNDSESPLVNPITNIRSDKMELMLEQKIDEQNYRSRKIQQVDDKSKVDNNDENIEE